MKHGMRRLLSMLLVLVMTLGMIPSVAAEEGSSYPADSQHTLNALAQGDTNGDEVTRTGLWTMNMIHNNPGLEPYESPYNDSEFLEEREIDGHVFFLYDCAQFGVMWDKFDELNGISLTEEEWRAGKDDPEIQALNAKKVLPYDSVERKWEESKKADILDKYDKAKAAGRGVLFMMDTIAVPAHLKQMYQSEICTGSTIDIKKEKTQQVLDCMMNEMLTEFPQIDGFTFRFGETYVGPKYGAGAPYHVGNNPIRDESYHKFFIDLMAEYLYGDKSPDGKMRDLIYRNWVHGAFQYDPATYLRITDTIEPNEHLYMCIKHSTGDFLRGSHSQFNRTIGIGKHQQIVEVQCAREYEGKGAFPNYIGDGVINGFEERDGYNEVHGLRDVVNCENSLVKGVWTWDRGGGWNGPYINGVNGIVGEDNPNNHNREIIVPDGSEMWCDLNTYVVTQWAKDTSKTDKYYAKQYAKEILGMSDEDAETFYKICILSTRAVWLMGFNGSNQRDNVYGALPGAGVEEGVQLWEENIDLANSLDDKLFEQPLPDSKVSVKDYIINTCTYGYYLFDTAYQMRIASQSAGDPDRLIQAVQKYDQDWAEWQEMYETVPGFPTLYMKEAKSYNFLGYSSSGGMDSVMNRYRPSLSVGKNCEVEVGKKTVGDVTYSLGNQYLTYVSSDENVATVDDQGVVTGVSEGYAKITVSTAGDDPLTGVFMVKVVEATEPVDPEEPVDPVEPPVDPEEPEETPDEPEYIDVTTTVFEQTFDTQDEVDAWTILTANPGGTLTWDEANHTMKVQGSTDKGKGDFQLTLDEPLTGKLTYSADVKVSKQENDSLTLLGSNNKIIAQLDFGGSNVANKIALNGKYNGVTIPRLADYTVDTVYHVQIDVNTDTQKFTVTITDKATGDIVVDGATEYTFRESAATDLGALKMGSRDGAVTPAILDGVMTIDNIKVTQTTTELKPDSLFKQTFDTQADVDAWTVTGNGGSKTWNETDKTMSIQGEADDGKGDFQLTLDEALTGKLTYSADIKVSQYENDSLTLLGSNGKILCQFDFGSSVRDNKLTLNGYNGTKNILTLVEYKTNTLYHVEISVDTDAGTFAVAVTDVETGAKLLDGTTVYTFREAATDLAALKMGSRDGAVTPAILDGVMTIDNIKIAETAETSAGGGDTDTDTDTDIDIGATDRYEVLFEEDFSGEKIPETVRQGTSNGTLAIENGCLTLSNGTSGEAILTLPEPIEGEAVITFKMMTDNAAKRAFVQPANSNGKHITQVEFRGEGTGSTGYLVIDKGSSDFPKLTNDLFAANTWYNVKIVVDTRTQKITVSVEDGNTVTLSSYKQSDGDNTALAQLRLGTRGATLTIDDIKIMREKTVEIPMEEIVKVTDINETVLKGDRLAFPAVPYGYALRVSGANPEGIFDENGKLVNRPGTDTDVELSLELVNTLDSDAEPADMGKITVHVKAGRNLVETTSLTLDRETLNLAVDEMDRLVATVGPEDAANKLISWDSSDWTVATVSQDGRVTAISEGTAIITVTSRANPELTASCTVTVKTSTSNSSSGGSASQYTITVQQADGGMITPSTTTVKKNDSKTFTIQANEGYEIADVLVDGSSVGAVSSYTFKKVISKHTITAVFEKVDVEESGLPFTDVKSGDWYHDAVEYVYGEGLMAGTSGKLFTPNGTLSRGMIVQILYSLEGKPETDADSVFDDVKAGAWYADAVNWAASVGVVSGYGNGKFGPDDSITREQLAAILRQYAALKGYKTEASGELDGFADADQVSGWATEAMQWAVSNGLMSGKNGGMLDPKGTATRAETAVILMQFCEKIAE